MTVTTRARRLAGRIYRRCAAPLGLRALGRMIDDGLPVRLASPIQFLFTGELSANARDARARVERRRQAIADRPETDPIAHTTTPHGLVHWPVERSAAPAGPRISGRWLAHVAAVPERWGLFLYLCADVAAAGTMLELGSSAGISAAYLASGRGCRRLMTLEGSPILARLAQATLDEIAPGASVIEGLFDNGLDHVFAALDQADAGLNLVYLDGHHDEVATLHYVARLLPRLRPGALVILDDIYLYEEMWRAWNRIRTMPGISVAVNLGRFGLFTCNEGHVRPEPFDLSRYTGRWRVGGSRRRTILGEGT